MVKEPEELVLDEDLFEKIIDYTRSKGYAYRTFRLYRNELKAIFKKYKFLDNKTIKIILDGSENTYKSAIIKLIINACEYHDIPYPKFKIISKIKKARNLPSVLSIDEIKLMVNSIKEENSKLFIRCIFSIGAGLRVSELIKLKWSDIGWVDWLKDKGVGVMFIKNTKRNKSFKVPIPREIMIELYEKAKKENNINEFGIPSGFIVFPFVDKIEEWEKDLRIVNFKEWTYRYVSHSYSWIRYNILQKYCEPALNKRLKIHSLRHTRATELLDLGIPIEEISELLGHSDIRTSMIYAKVNPKKIIKRFENINGV